MPGLYLKRDIIESLLGTVELGDIINNYRQKLLGTRYWLLVTGYWLLVTGYWLLVTGYWLLVTGYRLQVTGYWFTFAFGLLPLVANSLMARFGELARL